MIYKTSKKLNVKGNINILIKYNDNKKCFSVILNNKVFLIQNLLSSNNLKISNFDFTYFCILKILENFGLIKVSILNKEKF